MELGTCCGKLNNNGEWHASERRVEKLVIRYFTEREYKVVSHCLQDRFDIVAAKIISGPKIDSFIGVEIKSKDDTLKRLDRQITEYFQLFDFIYVALEEHQLPLSLPPFVGVIRISDGHIDLEREAHKTEKTLFPWCLTDAALARTIKASNGIQKRYKELKAYLSVLEDMRRKLIYNCIFWNDPLPFTEQEKKVVSFIEKKSTLISDLGIFAHKCGRARIVGE
jgi:hypothetical protein